MASRAKKLLTDEVALPARNARDVQAACDPWFDLEGKDLLTLREDLSGARGGSNRIKRIEECIRDARAGHYRLQLLSGHIGSGKTTELRWLAGELQKAKEDRVFHAIFIDVEQYLDARDVQIPELLTAIVSALVDDPVLAPHLRVSATAKKIWNEVVRWFKQIGISVDGEIPLGVAKLKASFKTSPGLQERYREESRKHVASLVEWLGDLLQDARSFLVKQGVEDLVVLVDKLDRVERIPLDDKSKRTRHDLFYLEQLPLIQQVPAHFVITIPVTLHFSQGRLHQVFQGATDVVLPMVAVHERRLGLSSRWVRGGSLRERRGVQGAVSQRRKVSGGISTKSTNCSGLTSFARRVRACSSSAVGCRPTRWTNTACRKRTLTLSIPFASPRWKPCL